MHRASRITAVIDIRVVSSTEPARGNHTQASTARKPRTTHSLGMETRACCRPLLVALGWVVGRSDGVGYFGSFELAHFLFFSVSWDFSMFQSVFLVHGIHSCDSSFRVHSGVQEIPHLATSVVLHSDTQSSCGCFGKRSSPCVIKTRHGSGALRFVNEV